MPYTELMSGFSLSYSETEISGTRVFVTDPNGAYAIIPISRFDVMLDEDGASIRRCKYRHHTVTYDGAGDPVYSIRYATEPLGGSGGGSISADFDQRYYTLGASQLSVPGEKLTWEGGTDKVEQNVYVRVPSGSITRTVEVVESQLGSWRELADGMAGKVNSDPFEIYDAGNVMFVGYSGGTTTGEEGDVVYRFDCHFEFLLLGAFGITSDSHQYMLRESDWTWTRPLNGAAKLYLPANFESLF